jgi:hypothetical protein
VTSYTITMISGGVTAGLDQLRAAFRALPDGDYTVRIAPVGDPIAAISEIVEWYGGLSQAERDDPNLLGELTERARLLATNCYDLARQVAAAKEQAAAEESAVKARRVVLMHGYRQEAEASGTKLSDAAAGRRAEYETLALQQEADFSERIANVLAEHLRAAKDVLGVMKTNHIPALRDERGQR